jgi:NADH dehydrogenase
VAEDVVKTFTRDWVVLRPGAVYGPGDDHLSVLLQMVRTLPVIPTIGDGNQKFQPVWHEDFSEAVARCVERDDVKCSVLEIAGADITSQNDLVDRMRVLTGRSVAQAPLPETLASWGMRALDAIGIDVSFSEAQLAMLAEGNVIAPDRPNGLTDVLGVLPTRLEDGLRRLVNEQPEQLPSAGVGPLTRKRYWVDIRGSAYDADGLFAYVRTHLADLMPEMVGMKAEPHAKTRIDEGETLTLSLPLRGHVQVRVAEVADRRITLLTVAGHPIAGAARFSVESRGDALRFEIQVFDRAASTFDELLMRTAGGWLQQMAWIGLAQNVAKAARGQSTQVQSAQEELDAHEMRVVDEWARTLAAQLSRNAASVGRD